MNESFQYVGSLYNAPRQALRAAVGDYLYASGKNTDADVAEMDPSSAATQFLADKWPVPVDCPAENIIILAVLTGEVIRSARAAVEEDAKEAFLLEAESRETSPEILEACWWAANGDYPKAVRVWEAPTDDESLEIWSRVTNNGLRCASDYCWGAAGSHWASQLGIETEETADDDDMVVLHAAGDTGWDGETSAV